MSYEYNLNEKKQKPLKKDCTLGEQLKYHRISKGIKRPSMSKLLNISLSSLISLEDNKDRVKFNVKIIKEYINILELNIDDLIINDDYIKFILDNPSKKIKNTRKQLKLTQRQFDDLIGVKHSCTAHWEEKRLLISKKNYEKLKEHIIS